MKFHTNKKKHINLKFIIFSVTFMTIAIPTLSATILTILTLGILFNYFKNKFVVLYNKKI
jgi:hypothetical protein